MNLERWSTQTSLDAGFAARWSESMQKSPLANFSMRLDHVQWEAANGRHATLVLAEHQKRLMALVLRQVGGEIHCGWPWRWQAVICDREAGRAPGPSAAEGLLLFRAAQAASGSVRLRVHLPVDPGTRAPGFRTGVTIVQRIDVSDEELLDSMDPNKRRLSRRAVREGFAVRLGDRPEDHRAYAALDREATQLRGETPPELVEDPAHGEAWREWEHPWMRLFVAERDGRVEACVGDGFAPGAMVDGRSAVTSVEARKAGVMALLCHDEARSLRDSGHRWFNHGGDTTFKREVSGKLGRSLVMYGWLGGGRRHSLANRAESLLWRSRPAIATWVRAAGRSLPTSVGRGREMVRNELERRRQAEQHRHQVPGSAALRSWTTDEPLEPAFERAWKRRLDASGHAGFAMRVDWLQWEAKHGRIARAMLIDEPDLRAAVVMRQDESGWHCGWPWRPQIVLEDPSDTPAGLDAGPLLRVMSHIESQVAPQRLQLFVPLLPGGPVGNLAGRTLVKPLQMDDEALLAGLHSEKRRAIKKAQKGGWDVRLASGPEEWRAFCEIQVQLDARRARGGAAQIPLEPAPGESWREWELPWHWLFVAVKDGVVHGGSGYGWAPNGVADYRTNASTEEGRKGGVNAMLAWVGLLHARESGCRWLNWGGATQFKRQFGGEPMEIHRVLGGGPLWAVPNEVDRVAHRTTRAVIELIKRSRASGKGKPS